MQDILETGRSSNILQDIRRKKGPYVLSLIGVNGVGKSTSLAKLSFYFLQNGLRVLIVACDTYRSGAVEQLAHHNKNLRFQFGDRISLFEEGTSAI
ncbi:MAG: hypothetical protein ACE3JU_00440 [Paenibacillus sp.]|uniref:hypothetical protein n=1 Tax=Paenibacillus sp. TaxID=58172 RepID=UPI003B7B426B